MKKMLVPALLLVAILFVSPVYAGKSSGIDMNYYTCNDLMQEDPDDIGLVLMWVDGYISCKTGDLTMDEDWIMEMAETISDACADDPKAYLIDIVERMARGM